MAVSKMDQIAVNPARVKEFYDSWVETYIKDFENADYRGPHLGAAKLAEFVKDEHARVLDAGCGVGTVGLQLKRLGFTNLDGVDLSPRSIEACKALNVYRELVTGKLGDNRLDIEDNSYDALISIGTFIPGHINQSAFPEFLRIVKPGGYIVIGMRAEFVEIAEEFRNGKLEGDMKRLADENKWELIQREPITGFFAGKPGLHFVCKVL